jgi:hypothetical protein
MAPAREDKHIIQHQFQLTGSDLERLLLVAGDLEYLIGLPKHRLLTHTEVRLSASILRRLLIDDGGEVFKLWRSMSPPASTSMTVEAPNIDGPLEKWPPAWILYSLAGGASVPGAHHNGFILASVPEAEWKRYGTPAEFLARNPLPTTGELERIGLQNWLKATSVAVQTKEFGLVKLTRHSVISYTANRKGGVHFDPDRKLSARAKPTLRKKQLEAQILDWDLLRVGTLWGYEFEVVSMVHAVASSDWATEMVRIAQSQAPQDFGVEPSTIRFWTGQKEADGTGWASMAFSTKA